MQPRTSATTSDPTPSLQVSAPTVSLPKGGGAVRGLGEKFGTNPVNGTGSMTIPIALSPGRAGFGPSFTLSYDSGAGNGPFGMGWQIAIPTIARKTDKGLPRYDDHQDPDVFVLSGAEDLVPVLEQDAGGDWVSHDTTRRISSETYAVRTYRPRIEGLFARIERWSNQRDRADVFWRSISRDNITTWYGKTATSRVADPEHLDRIFSWLICESYDDKGNAIQYEYKAENADGVDLSAAHERNRTDAARRTNRYLKRIRYGNHTPYFIDPTGREFPPLPSDWLFETVFDYGEHDATQPLPGVESHAWASRQDPFSTCRASFEVRTFRLCQRVLMFHHFPDELGEPDYLVRSTDFDYTPTDESNAAGTVALSFLRAVTHTGYTRLTNGSYLAKSLPPQEFEYSTPTIATDVQTVDAASLEHLPIGLDGANYRWVDLDGEGAPGILAEHAGALYYKPNHSPATAPSTRATAPAVTAAFGPLQLIAEQPSIAAAPGARQWLDLAGDGQRDLVAFTGPLPGFYERTSNGAWDLFKPFVSLPRIDWSSQHVTFADLTGDGFPDLVITDDEVFCWYASLGETGFGPEQKVWQALNEEHGPRVIVGDGTQSIQFGDMNGDGLPDVARIRNGEVCYWPNLGYGRFGAKIVMDNAPWFDRPDLFDLGRLRTADIDGTGFTDILYFGTAGVDIYFNQSGNGWSAAHRLPAFPAINDVAAIQVVDLLGTGTACLVWSSPLAGDANQPMRYVDLMGGQKPHLLIKSVNNLGAETFIHYAPSTQFYVADKLAGRPWITRLPFPVHVVERTETYDRISGNRFVTRYSYHHGYFDGVEREFRGFGLVEQTDTEEFAALSEGGALPIGTNIDEASHVPPVLTRTWFHTGVHLGRDRVSNFYAGLLDETDVGEYYREPDTTDEDAQEQLLPDTVLPAGMTTDEEREACRALKGAMLRQEIYALDGTAKASQPYIVTEQNLTVRLVQPQAGNRHAVFLTHAREAISTHYERNPADPRVTHALTLEVDEFGNVLKSAAIAYGRRLPNAALSPDDQAVQAKLHATSAEHQFTNAIDLPDSYRTPMMAESRSYELTNLGLAETHRFSFEEIVNAVAAAGAVPYETPPDPDAQQKRSIEHVRTLYRPNDLGLSEGNVLALLPLGQLQSLALAGESYKLALTPGLVATVFEDRVTDEMLAAEGRYVRLDDDDGWWIPSGRAFLSPNGNDDSVAELAFGRGHFFLAHRFRDPFHRVDHVTEGTAAYDTHNLFVTETRDALGNSIGATSDYRVLQAHAITDANGNRSEVAFDALGQVVGTAVMGKQGEGDSLAGFVADLDDATALAHLDNPLADAHQVLQQATTRLIYDLFAYLRTRADLQPQPAVVCALARETHVSDLTANEQTRIQQIFSYSDGFGREIQKKVQAEAGPLEPGGPTVSPRWVGTGWTIFNNKGKPVRQYEPFFSATHRFEVAHVTGVSPVLFYDPVGRLVSTLRPNHTWEKVVVGAWDTAAWDVNDTMLLPDPKGDLDVGDYFSRLSEAEYLPRWYDQRAGGELGPDEQTAALKTAAHSETPTVTHMDPLGRTFLTVAHNRFSRSDAPNEPPSEAFHRARVVFDIEGNQRAVVDALNRVVMQYDYDMLGARVHSASMDAGERWLLNDVSGMPLYAWNSRGHRLRATFDVLHRPLERHLQEGNGPELAVSRTIYGESQTDAESRNLRGRPYQTFDGAGVVTIEAYDFKGNLTRTTRQLAVEYRRALDWSASVPLEPEAFSSATSFDALNRPVMLTGPDSSVIRPAYNEANLLNAVDANLRGELSTGQPIWTPFVVNIDYSAKGQRERIEYGNGVSTAYEYDPLTFRLVYIQTLRANERLQDLTYTYDPVGNIARIRDAAQQTIYFRNLRVEASNDYTYDALYQLIEATGREHLGRVGDRFNPPTPPDPLNQFHAGHSHPGDGQAMGRYLERYVYDLVGNILEMQHAGADPADAGWTRTFTYEEPSLLEQPELPPPATNNQLSSTQVGERSAEPYSHDAHGNITSMPHLPLMHWNYNDQLEASACQVVNSGTPETTYYVYDHTGQRVRKVVDRAATSGVAPRRLHERICLGGFELYREYESDGASVSLERETLHLMDGQQRLALAETRTHGDDGSPDQLIRYQLGNHLGSASVELDREGVVISYEEFSPYGTTTYQALDASITAAAKRYRYTAKERDEENDLYYHGARYYAPWLGRWTSADPSGLADGLNLWRYVRNRPLVRVDRTGFAEVPPDWLMGIDLDVTIPPPAEEGPSAYALTQRDMEISRQVEMERAAVELNFQIARSDFFGSLVVGTGYLLRKDPVDIAKAAVIVTLASTAVGAMAGRPGGRRPPDGKGETPQLTNTSRAANQFFPLSAHNVIPQGRLDTTLPERQYAGPRTDMFHGGSVRTAALTRASGVRVDTNSPLPERRQWGTGYYLGVTRAVGDQYANQRADGAMVEFAEVPLAALGNVLDVTVGPGRVAWDEYMNQNQGGATNRRLWEMNAESRELFFNEFLAEYQLNPDVVVAPYGNTNQVIIRSPEAARILDLFLRTPEQQQ